MRKQKLSPKASKAKSIRDHQIAMTPARKKKRVDNQRIRRAKLTEMVSKLGSLSKARTVLMTVTEQNQRKSDEQYMA